MAITYQSIQSNTASGSSVVVTKPTGLAEGDLMIASVFSSDSGTITLPSGFSSIRNGVVDTNRFSVSFKIADSGDVAASNFTFSGGSSQWLGSILRYTTTTSFPSNPIVASVISTDTSNTTTPSFTINLNTVSTSTQFVSSFFVDASGITSSSQASSPARTWTERYDNAVSGASTSIATAPNTTVEDISTFSLTTSSAVSQYALVFVVISEVSGPITADISHLAVTPTIEGIVPAVNVATNIGHLTISPTIEGITVKNSSDDTQWVNETKPTTTWTNEQKL